MSTTVTVARILQGLIFVVFSLNYFLQLFSLPAPSEEAGAFLGALAATGYMFPLIKIVELVTGVLLLIGRWVPLALLVLSPVVVNIFLVHVFLDTGGLPLGLLALVLQIFLGWAYRERFADVLSA